MMAFRIVERRFIFFNYVNSSLKIVNNYLKQIFLVPLDLIHMIQI
jgi:hypothetical protein